MTLRQPPPRTLETLYDLEMLAMLAGDNLEEARQGGVGEEHETVRSCERCLAALRIVIDTARATDIVQERAWSMCARRYRERFGEIPVEEARLLMAVPRAGVLLSAHVDVVASCSAVSRGGSGSLVRLPSWTAEVLFDEHPDFVEDVSRFERELAREDVVDVAFSLWEPKDPGSEFALFSSAVEGALHLLD
jgi:hypothetical protein